jgi:hypothetical protein
MFLNTSCRRKNHGPPGASKQLIFCVYPGEAPRRHEVDAATNGRMCHRGLQRKAQSVRHSRPTVREISRIWKLLREQAGWGRIDQSVISNNAGRR